MKNVNIIYLIKEYIFDEPTRLVKVFTENSNKPRINGIISPDELRSHPKNPNICKFFREIGRSEELGYGFRTIYKYRKEYARVDSVIKDEDIFAFELTIFFVILCMIKFRKVLI